MPTVEDLLIYMGYDVTDDKMVNRNAQRALNTAIKTLHGSVGADVETYLPDDSRITELVLIFADDLYSNRGVSAKVSGATRRLVYDMEQQLRLDLRKAKGAAGV